jgi:hypothetical protein
MVYTTVWRRRCFRLVSVKAMMKRHRAESIQLSQVFTLGRLTTQVMSGEYCFGDGIPYNLVKRWVKNRARRTEELLKWNRNQFLWLVGLLAGLIESCLRKVLVKRRNSHTQPVRVLGQSLLKISSSGPLFYGTRGLSWRPCKQNPALRPKCETVEGLKLRSVRNTSLKVAVQGPAVRPIPYVSIYVCM